MGGKTHPPYLGGYREEARWGHVPHEMQSLRALDFAGRPLPARKSLGPGINSQIDGARPPVPGPPANRGAALLLYLLGR